MLSNLFIWEIRLKKFRLCYRERYLGGQKLCKYYFLLRFCNRDATCTWSLSIYYYCWSGSRSFVIHWRRVSSYSGNVTKKKKNSSKYVWACSYLFFFFFLTCLLYPTFYIFLFLLIIYFLLFTRNNYWCYFKIPNSKFCYLTLSFM